LEIERYEIKKLEVGSTKLEVLEKKKRE